MFGTARAATFELIPGYSDQSAHLETQSWSAWLVDNSRGRLYACGATYYDDRRFTAGCNQMAGWKSKLPASGNIKTTYNVQKFQADHTVVAWQIDEVTGKAQVCFPEAAVVNGDNCIDITPP